LAVALWVGEGLEAGGDGLVGGSLLFQRVEMCGYGGFPKLAVVKVE